MLSFFRFLILEKNLNEVNICSLIYNYIKKRKECFSIYIYK